MNQRDKWKKFIPVMAILAIAVILVLIVKISGEPLSVDTIVKYTPKNVVLAVIMLLLFFGLKSLTIVLPLSILYLASGILFSPVAAVFISTVGLSVSITIPYCLGKCSGKQITEEIFQKYPKAKKLSEYQKQNTFFTCFITRIVGFLPGDIVSLYFGACDVNYLIYLVAGISGSLLSIVTTTLLGEKLNNPFSIEFVLVAFCRLLVSIGSIMLKILFTKKQKKYLNKLPKVHNMLHSQTDNGDSNPAGSTRRSGFPPDFINFITLLFRPMAAIAIMMRNLDSSFSGANTSALIPILIHAVVIIAAMMKYKINIGNDLFMLKFPVFSPFTDADFAWIRDNTSVIGMIASVRVSLTVTALFNVSFPRFHMLSQVDAAAVTEEVSLIAVPANSPKEEPLVVSKPRTCPSTGNSTAAMTLKKKITEIAWQLPYRRRQ